MVNNNGTYKCLTCQTVIVIEGNKSRIEIKGKSRNWPSHRDCEIAKSVNEIDFTKLQKVV